MTGHPITDAFMVITIATGVVFGYGVLFLIVRDAWRHK